MSDELAGLSAELQELCQVIKSLGYDIRATWQDEYGGLQAVTGVHISIADLRTYCPNATA